MKFLTFGSFVLFTGLVGLITWWLTRRDRHDTSDGYFLAGRTLTGGYIAGSLMLTNLSTEQLVGLNGAAFKDGLCVMAWEVVAGVSLVIMALFFLPRYLKSGIATVPQFLEERFDATTRSITSADLHRRVCRDSAADHPVHRSNRPDGDSQSQRADRHRQSKVSFAGARSG